MQSQNNKRILLIGAGKLGAGIAYYLLKMGCTEIFLYGRDYSKTIGVAADLKEINYNSNIAVLQSLHDAPVMDITFFTFSALQWTTSINVNDRLIDAKNNIAVIHQLAQETSFKIFGTIIIVSNPVDLLVRYCVERYDNPNVFGFGNSLDEWRMMNTIRALGLHTTGEKLTCIGEHGQEIVPLLSTYLRDKNISPALYDEVKTTTFSRTQTVIRNISIPFYSPLFALEALAKTFVYNETAMLTLSSYLRKDYYGVKDLSIGIPMHIVNGKIEQPATVNLSDYEHRLIIQAAAKLNEKYEQLIK